MALQSDSVRKLYLDVAFVIEKKNRPLKNVLEKTVKCFSLLGVWLMSSHNRISIDNLNNSPVASQTLTPIKSESVSQDSLAKIQHQFKSQEKLTLLKQVLRFNPYKNKKTGWQQVKDGYLAWKNINRPKYADPAEDYIKRKVQEILRLYTRLGKELLKENGFNNKDAPDAILFLDLTEQILKIKSENEKDEHLEYHDTTPDVSVYEDEELRNPKKRKVTMPIQFLTPSRKMTLAELEIEEFMVLMNKNNQQFATTFATEFTKSISETLSKAIKEAIHETSKSNLEIIKSMENRSK